MAQQNLTVCERSCTWFCYLLSSPPWRGIVRTLPYDFAYVLPTLIYYKYLPLTLQYDQFQTPHCIELTSQEDLARIARLRYYLYLAHLVFTPSSSLSPGPLSLPLKSPGSIVTKVCVFRVAQRQLRTSHPHFATSPVASLHSNFAPLHTSSRMHIAPCFATNKRFLHTLQSQLQAYPCLVVVLLCFACRAIASASVSTSSFSSTSSNNSNILLKKYSESVTVSV